MTKDIGCWGDIRRPSPQRSQT